MARRRGRFAGTLVSLLFAWAIFDGLQDYARDHDGIKDPTPAPSATCYHAEDGTSRCVEP